MYRSSCEYMCQCGCIYLYMEVYYIFRGTHTHDCGYRCVFLYVSMPVDIHVCLRIFLGCSEEHNSLEIDSSSSSHCLGWHHRQLGYKRRGKKLHLLEKGMFKLPCVTQWLLVLFYQIIIQLQTFWEPLMYDLNYEN